MENKFKPLRIEFLSIFIILICFFFGAQSVFAASTPKKGGTITVAMNTDITTLDHYNSTALINGAVFMHILEPLVAYGKNLEIVPVLAERWEISQDYKTYTFHLMKGKLFHNGEEMTAEDVKYSLECIVDPHRCVRATLFEKVDNIEIVDKYAVKVNLKEPDTRLLHSLAYMSPIMAVIPKGEIEKQGGSIKHPMGTGPYKFVEWKPDRHIIFEKFDKYKARTDARNGLGGERIAYLDRIKFVPIHEEAVSIMAILNKEVDFLQFYPPKYVKKYNSDYKNKGIVLHEITGLAWPVIFFGMESPIVKNLKFRQACAYAIDRDVVVQAAFLGHAEKTASVVPESNQYWTPYHKTWYKKDLNKAKQLLKESGYNGEEVVIQTSKNFAYMFNDAIAVQSELKDAGIKTKINMVDWPVLIKDKYLKGDYQILSFGAVPCPDPAMAYKYLVRNKFEKVFPKAKEAREESLRTADFAKSVKIFEELHKMTYEQVPMIVLCHYNRINASRDYVKGYEPLSTAMPRFWGVWLDK